MNEDQARRLFNEANTTKSIGEQVLDEDEFIKFYFKLLQRPEIEKLFGRLVLLFMFHTLIYPYAILTMLGLFQLCS